MLTNSGGAIATLSFLGASSQTINLSGAKISLFLFVLGVFLAGVSTAKTFHNMSHLFKLWKEDVENYQSDEITWEQLQEQDKNRAINSFLDFAIPYASFGCFIGGSTSGALSVFL